MIIAFSLVGLGLLLLVLGGEALVRGAVTLAARAGVSPLLVGLVIVGFGTSAPELVASIEAALAGAPGIAWGNIIGSNIANSLLIMGAAVIITPLVLSRAKALRDPLIAFIAALAFAAVALAGLGHWLVGLAGLLAIGGYILAAYFKSKADHVPVDVPIAGQAHWSIALLGLIAGLGLLIGGGKLLVMGAVDLAELAGMSQTVIRLTVVAIGTSAPELATALVAARHKQMQVVFGNIIGSNIYNLLAIGGTTMLIAPAPMPTDLLLRDIPVMLAAMLLVLVVAFMNGRIGQVFGFGLLASYAIYIAVLTIS
ncbi:MAG: sodium:calcium antiporter [Paracoccaceae bacterium]